MAYYIGQNAFVGIALNTITNNESFDGAPGAYTYFKIKPGGFSANTKVSKNIIDELDSDPIDFVTTGKSYGITINTYLSYSYREKFIKLFMGDDLTEAGAGPYTHTFALADKIQFGAVKIIYTDEVSTMSSAVTETFTNFYVSGITFSGNIGGNVEMSISGGATTMTRTTGVDCSGFSIQETEPVHWTHLTPTINGSSAYHLGKVGINLSNNLSEAEFDHADTTPATLSWIGRSGQRSVKWSFDLRHDSTAYSLIGDTTSSITGTNTLVWNNGEAAGAEREISFTLGDSILDAQSRSLGAWGRETRSVSCTAINSNEAVLAVVTTNGFENV